MKMGYMAITCILLLGSLVSGCSDNEQAEKTNAATAAVISEPTNAPVEVTSPNVQKITFYSEALSKDMRFNIYLPIGYQSENKYPVLYLIHGYGSNETMWLSGLGLDKTADKLQNEGKIKPLIIVTPQIDNSYGFNSTSAGNYSDYLVKDLIQYVDSHYSTDATRESRYIGGLSMGGWAALYNAFTHPELFSKVGGHSPGLWVDDWTNTGDLKYWIYPSDEIRAQRDPILLAETQDLQGLTVYLDCGDEDSYKFYLGTEALYKKLQSQNIKSEYHRSPGGHDDNYWRTHESEYLLFYAGK